MKATVLINQDTYQVNCPADTTYEQLAKQFGEKLPYKPMVARVNGRDMLLTECVEEDCRVSFIDATTQNGNLVYQHTLSLVFLKAVKEVLGKVQVHIQNPLNKGLFVRIKTEDELTDEQISSISKHMEECIQQDLPIKRRKMDKTKAMDALRDHGFDDKADLLSQADDVHEISFYQIGNYANSFYGLMAPSAGYVSKFQLSKYRDGVLLKVPYTDNPNALSQSRDDVKLYEAFVKAEEWNKLLGIEFLADLNKTLASGGAKDMVMLSEALQEKRIAEIADMIAHGSKRIVLIAGPSSSGKTSFAKRLCVQLRVAGIDPLYMGTDDYFVEREDTPKDENGEYDFENLGAMDVELFNSNMNDLLAGKEVDMPTFNFKTGSKEFGHRITKLREKQVIVCEGIHALNEAMTTYINKEDKFKIYISPLTQLNIDVHNRISTTDARMLRRMVRDNRARGRSAEVTIREWPKVRAGEDRNIFPYNGEADVLFNSVNIYELALFKKYAQPLLEKVLPETPEYGEAQRLLAFLRFFKPFEGEEYIPNNSIIREFIGGSILIDE